MRYMKSIKHTLSFLLIFLLFTGLALSGCSSDETDSTGEAGSSEGKIIRVQVNDADSADDTAETAAVSDIASSETAAEDDSLSAMLDAEIQSRLTVDLITPNEYSRPQEALTEVSGVAVHYLANPGTTAQENRDYFDSLAETHETYASAHFIIGLDGEIIQAIPLDEISYCTNERNIDTISIECCHPDDSGYFNEATYESLVLLTAWLLEQYDLSYTDIIRHFDANGKICPLAFVVDSDYYYQFKTDVANTMGVNITIDEVREICNDTFMTQEEVDSQFQAEEAWENRHGNGDYSDYPPDDGRSHGGRHH